MGKPIEVTYTKTIYSCVQHDQPHVNCPWCWVLNQRLDYPRFGGPR